MRRSQEKMRQALKAPRIAKSTTQLYLEACLIFKGGIL